MSNLTSAPCLREALAEFIASAKPEAKLVYFTANNTHGYRGLDWTLKEVMTPDLRAVINGIRSLYNAGLVILVQLRPSRTVTHYVAVWRKHQAPPMGRDEQLPMVEQ